MSHSTGMCIQRLSAAASDGLRPAISFIFSKNACGKMCGKMSRRCSGGLAGLRFFISLSFRKIGAADDPISLPLGMIPVSPVVRGCLWMSGAVFSFSAMAIAVRQLLSHMGVFEVLFFRTFLALLAVTGYLALTGFGPI